MVISSSERWSAPCIFACSLLAMINISHTCLTQNMLGLPRVPDFFNNRYRVSKTFITHIHISRLRTVCGPLGQHSQRQSLDIAWTRC